MMSVYAFTDENYKVKWTCFCDEELSTATIVGTKLPTM